MSQDSPFRNRGSIRAGWGMAVLGLIGIMGVLMLWTPPEETQSYRRVSHQGTERERRVDLPYGSRVYLQPQSQISYLEGFPLDKRALRLDGEAYFEVVPDEKAFWIGSDIMNVTVTEPGTRLWVAAPAREAEISVVVLNGRALVSGGSATVQLEARQGIRFDRLGAEFSPPRPFPPDFLVWHDGQLHFIGHNLASALTYAEGAYGWRILGRVPNPQSCRFRADMPAQPEALLREIRQKGYNIERLSDATFVVRGTCRQ